MKKLIFLISLIIMVFNITACSKQEVKYDAVSDFHKGLAAVSIKEKWGLINTEGTMVVKPKYDEISIISSNLIIAKRKDKYGCIDKNGNTILKFKYNSIYSINDNKILRVELDNKFGVFNINGDIILDTIYDDISSNPNSDLIIIVKDNKYGFISNEKVITEPLYEKIDFCFTNYLSFFTPRHYLCKNYLKVMQNKRWGIMDEQGNLVIEPKFYDITGFSEGIAIIKHGSKYGFAKTDGTVIKPQYEEAYSFREGLAPITINDKWGYVDKNNNIAIQPQYRHACSFNKGVAIVTLKGNPYSQVINKKGNTIINPIYDDILQDTPGFFKFEKDGKYGLLRDSGELIAAPIYDKIRINQDKFIITGLDDKMGIMNLDGKEILPPVYDYIYCDGDFIVVKSNNKYGLLDKYGNKVTDIKYDSISKGNYNAKHEDAVQLFIVAVDKKYGFIDSNGNTIISPQFDQAHAFKEGFAAVMINGKWGFIARK